MKKLTAKWKIFWVLSYVQLIACAAIVFIFCLMLGEEEFAGDEDIILVCIALTLIPIANSGLNVYIMHRYFPDQPLPKATRLAMIGLSILTRIMLFFILLTCILSLISHLHGQEPDEEVSIIMISLMFADFLIGLYLLIFQIRLVKVLKRNSKEKLQELIESIGKQ